MSKRGENIYKRKDGRWEGRYIKSRGQDGQVKYGYVYASNYKTVRNKLIEKKYLYNVNRNPSQVYSGTVEQWLTHWLNHHINHKIKQSTYASYQYKLQHYIFPILGNCSLHQLDPNKIQNLVAHLMAQNLSVNTIKVILSIFKQGITAAIQADYLVDNPFKQIQLPSEQKIKVKALSLSDQRKIEAVASKSIKGYPTLLSLYTGMRIGEISALQWSDIDFERDMISVQHTYQRMPLKDGEHKTRLVLSKVKSSSSERMIPLGNVVKNRLLAWRLKVPETRFVFEIKGHPIEPRLLNYHFKKIVQAINMTDVHFHQLRHTFATRCLEAQENIAVISAILGHHSVKTTLDIYTDAMTFQKRLMIQKMEQKRSIKNI